MQRYHEPIEESKKELDSFETADMEQLLRFHKKLESILENLTDETQVTLKWPCFPKCGSFLASLFWCCREAFFF